MAISQGIDFRAIEFVSTNSLISFLNPAETHQQAAEFHPSQANRPPEGRARAHLLPDAADDGHRLRGPAARPGPHAQSGLQNRGERRRRRREPCSRAAAGASSDPCCLHLTKAHAPHPPQLSFLFNPPSPPRILVLRPNRQGRAVLECVVEAASQHRIPFPHSPTLPTSATCWRTPLCTVSLFIKFINIICLINII